MSKLNQIVSNEELVKNYQNGDKFALNELYSRYEDTISKRASSEHIKFPMIADDEFYSMLMMNLLKAVESFNPEKGAKFESWLYTVWARRTYDLVKRKAYKHKKDENGQLVRKAEVLSLDEITTTSSEGRSVQFEDKTCSIEATQSVEDTELFEYIKSKSEKDAKIAILLVQGYTQREIAQMLEMKSHVTVSNAIKRIQGYAKEFNELD